MKKACSPCFISYNWELFFLTKKHACLKGNIYVQTVPCSLSDRSRFIWNNSMCKKIYLSLKNVVDPGMQHHLPVLQQTASVSSEDSGTTILYYPIKLSKEYLNLEEQAFYSLSFNASKMTFGHPNCKWSLDTFNLRTGASLWLASFIAPSTYMHLDIILLDIFHIVGSTDSSINNSFRNYSLFISSRHWGNMTGNFWCVFKA